MEMPVKTNFIGPQTTYKLFKVQKMMKFRRLFFTVILLLLASVSYGAGLRLVWIGDSITDGGWGRSGGTMAPSEERNHNDLNHLYGHSYMLLCASELQSRRPECDYQCFNRGISGYTLAELETRWEQDVEALRPDLLTILVGTNDVDRSLKAANFDVAAWENRYRAYLKRTREAFPAVRLMLCTPFVLKAGRLAKTKNYAEREARVAACAEAVRRLAREFDARLVDFHALFARLEQQHATPTSYWIWDGIHPTAAGHRRMADLWLKRCPLKR